MNGKKNSSRTNLPKEQLQKNIGPAE